MADSFRIIAIYAPGLFALNVLAWAVEGESGEQATLVGPDIRLTGVRKQPLADRRACVAMRPEEFALGEGPGGVNTIAGRIDNVEYCGRDSLLDVVTASGTLLHVRSTGAPRMGDMVRVHIPVARTLVYPHE